MHSSKSKALLVRNTMWMFVGQGLRLLIQAFYFTLIARSLGASNYGAFVGVVALVGTLSPFGALGSGNLMVKYVAQDEKQFSSRWGAAISTTAICGSILIALILLLAHFLLPAVIPLRLVLLVAASDIIGLNLITISGQAFQAFERLHWTAAINTCISTARLLCALILIAVQSHPTALQWGYAYFGSTVFIVLMSSSLVLAKLGMPRLAIRRKFSDISEGVFFSIGMSSQTIYNDIDKTMLVRLSTLDATGIYGAAYRLIDVCFAPISALLAAAYANFFRAGAAGVRSSLTYARPLLYRAMAYGIVICIAILLCAGLVPVILGAEYARTAEALRWLSLLPLLKAMHYFLSDTLTGAGYQALRSGIQAGVALFNIAINMWLIPRYSWRGAAWSSIASDALLALAVGVALYCLSHRAWIEESLVCEEA